ncbi:MAG TPA: elongation factor P [Novosphingobium sp.]|nr:elongation factor P [Novosphingobium sp.]
MVAAAPALADGPLGAVKRGDYVCELPGDAMGKPGIHQPAEDFSIQQHSIYINAQGKGTYLLIGNRLTMTSGPKHGTLYRRVNDTFWRKLNADGSDNPLRCIRSVLNNR